MALTTLSTSNLKAIVTPPPSNANYTSEEFLPTQLNIRYKTLRRISENTFSQENSVPLTDRIHEIRSFYLKSPDINEASISSRSLDLASPTSKRSDLAPDLSTLSLETPSPCPYKKPSKFNPIVDPLEQQTVLKNLSYLSLDIPKKGSKYDPKEKNITEAFQLFLHPLDAVFRGPNRDPDTTFHFPPKTSDFFTAMIKGDTYKEKGYALKKGSFSAPIQPYTLGPHCFVIKTVEKNTDKPQQSLGATPIKGTPQIQQSLTQTPQKYSPPGQKNSPTATNANQLSCLENELRVYMTLPKHPNILACYAYFNRQLCLEEGSSDGFEFFIRQRNPAHLSPSKLLNYFLQVARGLNTIHKANLVHRDVKAENIIISKDDEQIVLKIADFGMCTEIGSKSAPIQGSRSYFSPSLLEFEKDNNDSLPDSLVQPHTDCYAFGVFMHVCVTNRFPFSHIPFREKKIKEKIEELNILYPEISDDDIKFIAVEELRINYIRMLFSKPNSFINLFEHIPQDMTDLLKLLDPDCFFQNLIVQCLEVDDSKRPTMDQVLKQLSNPPKNYIDKAIL